MPSLAANQRRGLVLGAGGPVGHAFHAGVLRALAEAWAWDPRDAALVIGTSAGAQVGALLRAGMSAPDLAARVTGEPLSAEGARIARHYRRPSRGRVESPRRFYPASPALLARTLLRPWGGLGRLAAALLPEGRASLHEMAEGFRALYGDHWPTRPLWIPALHLPSGQRVTFGTETAPRTDVGSAVSSSGAIPGIVQPVRIAGERYVDGGMVSLTNLDLVGDADLDLVVVSSPLSRFAPIRLALARQVRRVTRAGTRVVVFEPRGHTARVMGLNPMDGARAGHVAAAAYATTLEHVAGIARIAETPDEESINAPCEDA